MTLDEERLELVRRTANFAATDAADARRLAKIAIVLGVAAIVIALVMR